MTARFGWKNYLFSCTAILIGGLAGCGSPTVDAPPAATETIELYAEVPGSAAKLLVYRDRSVNIQWPADITSNGVRLAYRDVAGDVETDIAPAASGGAYAWTVPATLSLDTDYEILAYAVGGEVVEGEAAATVEAVALARSVVFIVADVPPGDVDSNGLPDTDSNGSPCSVNEDCDDGLYCNGVELCVASVCAGGASPCGLAVFCDEVTQACIEGACLTDEDCLSGGACVDGLCAAADAGSNGLMGFAFDTTSNGVIDFSQALTVGDTVQLVSPGVTSGAASTAADASTTGCACVWSVDPATAGTYNPADACETEFTVAAAGPMELSVEVTCAPDVAMYRQDATADPAPPPLACVDDTVCASGERCLDGFCGVPPPPAPTIEVLEEVAQAPYVVRFDMRLKNTAGEVIADGVTSARFRVFENGTAIDLTETNRFVTPAENLPLRIVLVLDYSNSMRVAAATGAMVQAAVNFVRAEHFTATHHLGVVEFHDRGDEGEGYSAAVPLTSADTAGKQAIVAGIPTATALESGLTRVWDAVDLAVTMLNATERQPGEVRAIVFLTDGRDTTSETDAATIAAAAGEGEITLYPIGFGDVTGHEAELRALAAGSGGAYFPATRADELLDIFNEVALDLRGQWNLTYITQRNSGLVDARIEFDWENQTAIYETAFDAGQLNGDIHRGVIEILNRAYDPYVERTRFLLKATYIPRGINRFRFVFAHSEADFALQGAGGLTDPAQGWTRTAMGAGGYLLLGAAPLEYGAFGNFGVASVPGKVDKLQVTHDDSLYSGLSQPKTMIFEGDLWAKPYTLTTAVSPEAAGVVVVAPHKAGYGHGEKVLVTAIPAAGKIFSAWTGAATGGVASVTITMDGDKAVTASFAEPPAEE